MFRQGDFIIGVGPEAVQMAFAEIGIKIVVKHTGSWDTVQMKARTGEVDVLVAAYKNPERETYMDYSIPYTTDPVSIYVKSGNSFPFANWSELIGKKGVVTRGDSYGPDFDKFIKDSLTVTEVNSPADAFALINSGQANYFVYALYSGDEYISTNNLKGQFERLANNVTSENFYVTISKKSPLVKYLAQINEILTRYIADGTIDALIIKYKK